MLHVYDNNFVNIFHGLGVDNSCRVGTNIHVHYLGVGVKSGNSIGLTRKSLLAMFGHCIIMQIEVNKGKHVIII